jgi:hypothetical protein
MDRVIPILTVVALVAAWNFFIYKRSGGRAWSPLGMAFSSMGVSVLYLVAGTIGYTLSKHDRFVAHTAWTGHVIWSEIAIGLLTGLAAFYFWRKGLQSIRPV